MKRIFAAAVIAVSFTPLGVLAQERAGDAALGALSGGGRLRARGCSCRRRGWLYGRAVDFSLVEIEEIGTALPGRSCKAVYN